MLSAFYLRLDPNNSDLFGVKQQGPYKSDHYRYERYTVETQKPRRKSGAFTMTCTASQLSGERVAVLQRARHRSDGCRQVLVLSAVEASSLRDSAFSRDGYGRAAAGKRPIEGHVNAPQQSFAAHEIRHRIAIEGEAARQILRTSVGFVAVSAGVALLTHECAAGAADENLAMQNNTGRSTDVVVPSKRQRTPRAITGSPNPVRFRLASFRRGAASR